MHELQVLVGPVHPQVMVLHPAIKALEMTRSDEEYKKHHIAALCFEKKRVGASCMLSTSSSSVM